MFIALIILCNVSVPDAEEVLNEADVKLDAVRQKIGLIADELKGEDIYQFHKAFTPGKFTVRSQAPTTWT